MTPSSRLDVSITRWIGRVAAVLLFVLWGMFFIEHLVDFLSTPNELPPVWVWGVQAMHLVLLLSLLASLKWPAYGSLAIVLSATSFFLIAAGSNFLPLTLLTCIPVPFHLYAWWRSRPKV